DFDRIASIEMFEAVGEKYWPTFFSKLRQRLCPDGLAGLQIITIADDNFEEYRGGPDFIQRYIFPGGMLPSPSALMGQFRDTQLELVDQHGFGLDYARTLAEWHQRFEAAWPDLEQQGIDESFRRLWRYYLSYCETGFTNRTTDVVQLVLRPAADQS
ncbi:MAG: class I SAM-dependent methyltransferase, partial [Pseudomonadota bacterium]